MSAALTQAEKQRRSSAMQATLTNPGQRLAESIAETQHRAPKTGGFPASATGEAAPESAPPAASPPDRREGPVVEPETIFPCPPLSVVEHHAAAQTPATGVTSPGEQRAPVQAVAPTRVPDRPVVTITISGPPDAGKTVIAHVIRNALAREGIAASGPERLRSLPWRRGLDHLLWRGLTVELRRDAP